MKLSFRFSSKRKRKSENNASIVIWAKFGGLTWLFTGDLEEEGEQFWYLRIQICEWMF